MFDAAKLVLFPELKMRKKTKGNMAGGKTHFSQSFPNLSPKIIDILINIHCDIPLLNYLLLGRLIAT